MEQLSTRIITGTQTPVRNELVLIRGSVTDEDWEALRRAAAGDGEVLLDTEYGPWRFRITPGASPDAFHLVSVGMPGER